MQEKHIGGIVRLILSLVLFICLDNMAVAQTDYTLSTADERAFQQSHASWMRLAEANQKIGLPPMGEEPQRKDFVGYADDRHIAAAAQDAADRAAKTLWQQRLDDLQPFIRDVEILGKKQPDRQRVRLYRKEQEGLREFTDRAWANRDAVEASLDAIALKHGVSRTRRRHDGRLEQLAGEYEGYPIWISSHNQIAAAGISADELWPSNSAPWPSSSTGRDLTGDEIVLGMWEAEGKVHTGHAEFGMRVLQLDDDMMKLCKHATGVAGTMAAHGNSVTNLPSIPTGSVARGVAFEAYVDAYTTYDFAVELADASLDVTNIPGLRLSNHSWGYTSAWDYDYIDEYIYGGVTNTYTNWWFVWRQHPNFYEDPLCGLYLPNVSNGWGGAQLDSFLSSNAPRHLLVYSAGNDRFAGPGQRVYYFYESMGAWYLVNNPPEEDKDWSIGDGDTYGFDSVKPPGTSKNVLTVGSVLDVYHDEGRNLRWGYASNSVVELSSFSGCGPTDDGRIKPDVVAVGQADPAVRAYGLVTPDATGNYTTNYDGTSFSAPLVTAGLGLCLQRRGQLFPNLDPAVDAWRSSTLKALAIHTADDVLNPGPDYQSGWGLFNAVLAVEQIELDAQDGRGTHLKELELAVGVTNSWRIDLDGSPFKATMAWSDPPGVPTGYADDPTPMLVNNLDLWIETEDGTQVFRPWILDPDLQNEQESNRNAFAVTGIDDRNNVEQVYIENPIPGRYRICVAHAGGTAGGQTPSDQWASIATSGDAPLPPSITQVEQTQTNGTFLLAVESDPGSHLLLETTTSLLSSVWHTNGVFTTGGNTNIVFSSSSDEKRFFRIRRETGE